MQLARRDKTALSAALLQFGIVSVRQKRRFPVQQIKTFIGGENSSADLYPLPCDKGDPQIPSFHSNLFPCFLILP